MGKKVLISGYIGFQNFGDDAILGLLVRNLRKANCNITALSSDPESTEKMFKINALNYMNFFQILWAILDTKVLISGGGSLLQTVVTQKISRRHSGKLLHLPVQMYT